MAERLTPEKLPVGRNTMLLSGGIAALPAGRAMDRLGRVPVLAGGFALGILRCIPVGTENALVISDLGIVPDGSHHRGLLATLSAPQLVTFWRVAPLGTVLGDLLRRQVS
jgi:MFS family permease